MPAISHSSDGQHVVVFPSYQCKQKGWRRNLPHPAAKAMMYRLAKVILAMPKAPSMLCVCMRLSLILRQIRQTHRLQARYMGSLRCKIYSTSCTPLYDSSLLLAPCQSIEPLTSASTTSMTVSIGPMSWDVESRSL